MAIDRKRYAAYTKVPIVTTKLEIEKLVRTKYGAEGFGTDELGNKAQVRFQMHDRYIRITMNVPDNPQEARARWRALLMIIKAKLESIETGISTFEHAFMGDIVMPTGQTLGEMVLPHVEQAYLTGEVPKLLPDYSS